MDELSIKPDQQPQDQLDDQPIELSGAGTSPVSPMDDLISRLKSRVEQRRASGEYPDGLEEELDAHFKRIVFHRTKSQVDQLEADVEALDSHMAFSVTNIAASSEVPGGELLHRALNKAMLRSSQGILEQVQDFAEAVRRAIRTLAATVQDPTSHTHADLVGHLDAVLEKLTSFERSPVSNEAALGDLRRRVEELEKKEAAREFKPWFKSADFEARVRDTGLEVPKKYGDLADEFLEMAPVLDIGCGGGEFLLLLKERGIEAWGAELDPDLVEIAAKVGVRSVEADGLAVLAMQPDASLGGIVLLQVIEHLTEQQQLDLISLAYEKLRKGGKIIIETVNPQSLYNLAHAFYIDPTHTTPVHPAYLSFLFEVAGFSQIVWQWRNDPPLQDVLEHTDVEGSVEHRNVNRLNTLLFSSMDYALVVTK